MQKLVMRYAIVAAGLTLIGCASPQPPTKELRRASGSIRAAQELGAQEHPQAQYHLTLAREALGYGERLIAAEEMANARVMLRRARADAEMAIAMARLGDTRAEATRIAGQVKALEQEMRRAGR